MRGSSDLTLAPQTTFQSNCGRLRRRPGWIRKSVTQSVWPITHPHGGMHTFGACGCVVAPRKGGPFMFGRVLSFWFPALLGRGTRDTSYSIYFLNKTIVAGFAGFAGFLGVKLPQRPQKRKSENVENQKYFFLIFRARDFGVEKNPEKPANSARVCVWSENCDGSPHTSGINFDSLRLISTAHRTLWLLILSHHTCVCVERSPSVKYGTSLRCESIT